MDKWTYFHLKEKTDFCKCFLRYIELSKIQRFVHSFCTYDLVRNTERTQNPNLITIKTQWVAFNDSLLISGCWNCDHRRVSIRKNTVSPNIWLLSVNDSCSITQYYRPDIKKFFYLISCLILSGGFRFLESFSFHNTILSYFQGKQEPLRSYLSYTFHTSLHLLRYSSLGDVPYC